MRNLPVELKEKQLRKFIKERTIELTMGMEEEALSRFERNYGEKNPEAGRFGCLYRAILDEMWQEYCKGN